VPELPEVEIVKRGLNDLIVDKQIVDYEVLRDKSFPNDAESAQQFLLGSKITSIRRRAKVLLIDLSSEYTVAVHLKMTGQLVYRSNLEKFGAGHPNDSLVGSLPDSSTRVILAFKDKSKLFFNDQRVFGWMRLLPTKEVEFIDFMKKLGPEPLESNFSFEVFKSQLLRRKNSRIKAVLLDQTVVAGIGNIYADEALWSAMIHPETRVVTLSDDKIEELRQAIVAVMKESIAAGGSTDRNYVNAEGKKGSYISFAKVFRREGQACHRCGEMINKIRSAGRGTHVCNLCQVAVE
jgi:formamidopyrimidine-DNA glycosylase